MKNSNCPCGKGHYTHGSALYDYFSCGHAYQKPLRKDDKEGFVVYQSPYEPYKSRYGEKAPTP